MQPPNLIHVEAAPLQPVHDPLYTQAGVELWVKREDLLHPEISGNKWRKLKYSLVQAQENGHTTLLTFGGAYSNHLLAVAAAGQVLNLATVGIVRGEKPAQLSPTLQACQQKGMTLRFVSRSEYRQRHQAQYLHRWQQRYPEALLIPEGGTAPAALAGVAELWQEVDTSFHWAVTAVGTGGTLAGLVQGAPAPTRVLGVVVLKGYHQMESEIRSMLAGKPIQPRWHLELNAHHGGYAKTSPQLLAFIRDWPQKHGFLLDPIYTGKIFYYLHHRIRAGYFPRGTRIMALHTGGLQGIAGYNQRLDTRLPESP